MGDSHRNVEALLREVHDAIGVERARRELRMQFQEFEDERRDVHASESCRRCHGQIAAQLGLDARDGGFGIVDLGEDALAVAEVTFARLRETHDARGAVKQAGTDSRFEHGNAACHGGRRQRETACRRREAAPFGDGDERSHGIEAIHFYYCYKRNSYLSISAILVAR